MKKSKTSSEQKKTVVHGIEMTEAEARRLESDAMEFREIVASIASGWRGGAHHALPIQTA